MKFHFRFLLYIGTGFICLSVAMFFFVQSLFLLGRQRLIVSTISDDSQALSPKFQNSSNIKQDKLISIGIDHIISTGQSLALGLSGSPALSTTQPYNNLQLENFSFEPLIEREVESMSSALANHITFTSNNTLPTILVSKNGKNGIPYVGLKKGSDQYESALKQVYIAKENSTNLGKPYKVIGVTAIHGESDHVLGTTEEQYRDDLIEWQKDYESDIQMLTAQSKPIPLFTDQFSAWSIYDTAHSIIPIAQYDASKARPKNIILVGPKYFLQYGLGSSHLINTSYRWLGEYYGKVIKKVVYEGESFTPLSPKRVVSSGRDVYLQLHVPVSPIVIDTKSVLYKLDYGFEFLDNKSRLSISRVQMYGTDMIKITLKTKPIENNQRLRYAYTATPKSDAGAYAVGSARGNIRDSDSTESQYGNKLYNWLVHFDEPVEKDTSNPIISIAPERAIDTGILISDDTNISSLDFFGIDNKISLHCNQTLPFIGKQAIQCDLNSKSSGFLTVVATDLFGKITRAKFVIVCDENPILKGLKVFIGLVNNKKVTNKCSLYSIY